MPSRPDLSRARIRVIQTHYPHWGPHSGTNPFANALDSDRFRVVTDLVPMGGDQFPPVGYRLRQHMRTVIRSSGMQAYGLNDACAEGRALGLWLLGGIDIVHYLDGEHSLQYLPRLLRRFSKLRHRVPIVATFHQPPELLLKLTDPEVLRMVDCATVLCPEQAAHLQQFLPSDRVQLIPLGIDSDFFQPDAHRPASAQFRCLSVGTWLRDYDTVLTVAEMLQGYPDIRFEIVSNADLKPRSPNVQIRSGLDDLELRREYQQSDVLFVPMLSATANCAILEAIACGLPVVSSALPSVRMYLPGDEGLLIPDRDPARYADAILALRDSPQRRLEMGRQARLRALELSWSKIAAQYEAIYVRLV